MSAPPPLPARPPPIPPRTPTAAPAQPSTPSAASSPTSAGSTETKGDGTPGVVYHVPKAVDISTLKSLDSSDQSLNKYKDTLLGSDQGPMFPNDPRKVIVQEVRICSPGRNPIVLQAQSTTKQHYKMKEGVPFHIEVDFYIQRDIVSGLKFINTVSKLKIEVDKNEEMMGSYAPSSKKYTFKSAEDEAPSGFLARTTYNGQAVLRDDDKFVHHSLDYTFEITKDW